MNIKFLRTKPNVRFNKIPLWAAAFIVFALAAFPLYRGYVTGALSASKNNNPVDDPAGGSQWSSEIILKVEGMTCAACEIKVKNAVLKIPGVVRVEADRENGEARVFVEGKNILGFYARDLSDAVRKAGYESSIVRVAFHHEGGETDE